MSMQPRQRQYNTSLMLTGLVGVLLGTCVGCTDTTPLELPPPRPRFKVAQADVPKPIDISTKTEKTEKTNKPEPIKTTKTVVKTEPPKTIKTEKPANDKIEGPWATIRGQVVWDGDLPKDPDAGINKDAKCLAFKPQKQGYFVIDPKSKGISNLFVYVEKPSKIHASYPQDADAVQKAFVKQLNDSLKTKGDSYEAIAAELQKQVDEKGAKVDGFQAPIVMNQVKCVYVPKAVAAREGEAVLVLNPDPTTHNVLVSGFVEENNSNETMAPNSFFFRTWKSSTIPLNVACSIHPWMSAKAMVFKHPYFATTDKDGKFEIRLVPAGELSYTIRSAVAGYADKGGKRQRRVTVTLEPGQVLDLGKIAVTYKSPQ